MNDEAKKKTTHGLITGRGHGDWGRITVRTDSSILLENVALSNIAIRNCDLHAESGERPIPFADRMNELEDWATGSPQYPDTKLWAGHTHGRAASGLVAQPQSVPYLVAALRFAAGREGDHCRRRQAA